MSKSKSVVLTTLEKTGGFVSAQEVFQLLRKQGKPTGLQLCIGHCRKLQLRILLMFFEKKMVRRYIVCVQLGIITT
jgi:hypothetical protein